MTSNTRSIKYFGPYFDETCLLQGLGVLRKLIEVGSGKMSSSFLHHSVALLRLYPQVDLMYKSLLLLSTHLVMGVVRSCNDKIQVLDFDHYTRRSCKLYICIRLLSISLSKTMHLSFSFGKYT
jgi:hypothetical protein